MSESSPEIRASDADRDRMAKRLQEHFAQGRLDGDEFNARMETAYRARTRGELERVTEDLPERDLADLPGLVASAPGQRPRGVTRDPALVIPWLTWGGVNTLCFLIWLIVYLTNGASYPWFLWVLGPWGVVMLFVTLGVVALNRGQDPN
ncbi:DUF1707 SHOCT-like domain-containing protein [Actinorugispora endophytica]|uniref:Uncharacterized protein DUF1707 n=1 Tax=Actinorugispora endophytica TaxID=1605990 RepID=A0A4R6V0J9_9ACTN|nr:DUF1707 domain-containing protein [Actinorugispora endophytica]TDQ51455.1 uncharacterized protein DUF1707 [Actinorugispora endophytica]